MTTTSAQLQTKVSNLESVVIERDATIAAMREELGTLRHNIEVYRRMAFGPSSEKRTGTDAKMPAQQGHLFATALAAEAERVAKVHGVTGSLESAPPTAPKAKRSRPSRFPDHLPRVTTRYELTEEEQVCTCGGELHEIGLLRTRELERLETSIAHEIQRVKYACRKCQEGVKTAPGPNRVIKKGLLGPGFLAHVAVDRFGDHMPYHRLEKKYAREGLSLGRSVLERSMATCAELLEPIWTEMGRSVLESPAIFTDDTTITIARGSAGKSRKGRMWIYLDQRDQHYYDFTETREQARPLAVLCGYTGYIHADAYPGYDAVFGPDLATEVACWAHTRRKFVEAENTQPEKAKAVIDRIRRLYRIETRAKDEEMSPQLRLDLRRRESVPLLAELREYLGMLEGSVLPKSPLAKAVGYAQRQWKALNVYTTDGRLEIDNNTAERAMRPVAVGRKGWLFVQSIEGGQRAAILLSLVMTAKAIGINPVMYLRDILVRISVETDVRKLTPHGWAEHYAEQVSIEYEAATARLLGR